MRKVLARRAGARALRLRLGRQPRAGHGLRLPPLRRRGRRVHAGDDAAAEDRQDPAVRRRPGRDPAGRRLFRRDARRGAGFRRGGGRAVPAALRRCRRHRGPGDLRPRDPRAVAGAAGHRRRPGRRRRALGRLVGVAAALAPATAIRLVEPAGAPSLRRALEAGGLVTLPGRQLRRRRGGGADRRPELRGLCAASRRRTWCSRRRTGSAPRWSRC